MISIFCLKCGDELEEPGGLVFSPPSKTLQSRAVSKIHLCVKCYKEVEKFIYGDLDE